MIGALSKKHKIFDAFLYSIIKDRSHGTLVQFKAVRKWKSKLLIFFLFVVNICLSFMLYLHFADFQAFICDVGQVM